MEVVERGGGQTNRTHALGRRSTGKLGGEIRALHIAGADTLCIPPPPISDSELFYVFVETRKKTKKNYDNVSRSGEPGGLLP